MESYIIYQIPVRGGIEAACRDKAGKFFDIILPLQLRDITNILQSQTVDWILYLWQLRRFYHRYASIYYRSEEGNLQIGVF